MRRRGYPPSAIRLFCERMGISKIDSDGGIQVGILEDCGFVRLKNAFVLRLTNVVRENNGGNIVELDMEVIDDVRWEEEPSRDYSLGGGHHQRQGQGLSLRSPLPNTHARI
mmetsp:Transcript_29070/g.35444  ORF Transcript_29070/g.35444 Transcript_29070/m.35444 type:complete len:111 (-) Transcript_29070:198-530(-)